MKKKALKKENVALRQEIAALEDELRRSSPSDMDSVLAAVIRESGFESSGHVLCEICNETRVSPSKSIIEHVKDLRRIADKAEAERIRRRKPKLKLA